MNSYLRTVDNDWFRQRLGVIVFCVVAAFVVLFLRLAYLQVIEGDYYHRLSVNNRIRLQDIDSPRGLIYDRNGTLLVDNRPSFNLSIVLKDAAPLKNTLAQLAHDTDIPMAELQKRIRRHRGGAAYKPILLRSDIGRNMLAAVEVHKFDLPGVEVTVKPRRQYVDHRSASHLIGYLSEINAKELRSGKYPGAQPGDFIGRYGVERAFESYLRGKHGGRQVEVDATGRVVKALKTVPAQPGNNIYLTIDHRLQRETEALLEGQVGAAVAMDPRNGQVLAMASSPDFDPNAFVDGMTPEQWKALSSDPDRPMENKAISGEYPPASTYKIVTAMAGLEEGVIDGNTVLYDPGYYVYGDRTFRCWKKTGHGHIRLVNALAQSCDVYFYQVGQRLGVDRLAFYAVAAGLGSPTGIRLNHEASGLVPTAAWKLHRFGRPWQGGETLSVAIGQGYDLVTPIQMAVLISAVANGGKRFRPIIIDSVRTADGKVILRGTPQLMGRLPVSKANLDLVRKGLWAAVNTPVGTAYRHRLPNVAMSGKTGTAQLISRPTDDEKKTVPKNPEYRDHAWFVAYAPSENPRIGVAVIIEHGEHGASAAAPIVQAMIRTWLEETSSATKSGPPA